MPGRFRFSNLLSMLALAPALLCSGCRLGLGDAPTSPPQSTQRTYGNHRTGGIDPVPASSRSPEVAGESKMFGVPRDNHTKPLTAQEQEQLVARYQELLRQRDERARLRAESPPVQLLATTPQPLNSTRLQPVTRIPNDEQILANWQPPIILPEEQLPIDPNEVIPPPPPGPIQEQLPLQPRQLPGPDMLSVTRQGERLTLVAREAALGTVLGMIAEQLEINIVTSEAMENPISVTLNEVTLSDALDAILSTTGYRWVNMNNIIVVSRMDKKTELPPHVQGRKLRVFDLHYVSATDVEKVVTGLLSPIGQVFTSQISGMNSLQTRERIVVEDVPESIRRIESYLAQIDMPPRQVMIEAHILQVKLSDESRHGINLDALANISGSELRFRTTGFANPNSSPAVFLGLDSGDVDGLIECLKTTTDAKTLASPRVLAINGQQAKIQIGAKLGYLVTTTTQTSTLQNVDFLDVGVVLTVTPYIGNDGQIMMNVLPEVSSGRINERTGLPEEETTEVSTNIVLPDGHGVVIGGLIQETDNDQQSKMPVLGDLWLVGRLFRRELLLRERQEIIIALIPRLMPYAPDFQAKDCIDFERATTPLLTGPLQEYPRPWEPTLPDPMKKPRKLQNDRIQRAPFETVPRVLSPNSIPRPAEYYAPTREEFHGIPPTVYPYATDQQYLR